MQKEFDNINNKMTWLMILLVVVAVLSLTYICNAANSNLRFSWDAVTINADGTPCTDLGGYTIYRSRDANNWNELTGAGPAFVQVAATETFIAATCPEAGVWYWIIRAFDTSGNYSGISEVLIIDIDISIPNAVFHFRTCQAGDINCDGDVDGADLVEFSEAFGR